MARHLANRVAAVYAQLATSLFFVPMLYVIVGAGLAQVALAADDAWSASGRMLPLGGSTVESARAVLSTIAAATLSFAGIAVSVSLLLLQLASSQYSPRVVHGLFRDPFNKQVIGIVVGTFTYCLLVLRAVRSPLEEGGSAVAPDLSVWVAVALGLVAVGALVAFINHNAHAMDVAAVLAVTTEQALDEMRDRWDDGTALPAGPERVIEPPADGHVVRFATDGWIQQLDAVELLGAVPAATTVWCHTQVGRYAVAGTALCTLFPAPADDSDVDERVRRAVRIGRSRSLSEDPAYGIRQLADVALRALSPGVNDPTTAQDALFHLASVLAAALRRRPPARQVVDGDRRLLLPARPSHGELVDLGFDEVRRAAAPHPKVCVYILEVLALLTEVVEPRSEARGALDRQARLVLAGCGGDGVLVEDLAGVRAAYDEAFGDERRVGSVGLGIRGA